MIAKGSKQLADKTRRHMAPFGDVFSDRSDWMMAEGDIDLSPTVFMIEQPPGMMLPAHFHHNNQFQLFVAGSGKIGARRIDGVMLHYAGAYTSYGPLVAGDAGLKYLTIRTVREFGAVKVEDAPTRGWPKGPRRHATSKPIAVSSADELSSARSLSVTSLFLASVDGLASSSITLPPDAALPPTETAAGDGVFFVVLAGTLLHGEDELVEWESLYISADEAPPELRAGKSGTQVVVMVPPRRDEAYRHELTGARRAFEAPAKHRVPAAETD